MCALIGMMMIKIGYVIEDVNVKVVLNYFGISVPKPLTYQLRVHTG